VFERDWKLVEEGSFKSSQFLSIPDLDLCFSRQHNEITHERGADLQMHAALFNSWIVAFYKYTI